MAIVSKYYSIKNRSIESSLLEVKYVHLSIFKYSRVMFDYPDEMDVKALASK